MATTTYGTYFEGTEYYVNYSTGTDDGAAGRGESAGDPWKTIKHAVEHADGIPSVGASGDRINCHSGTTHTMADGAGESIDVSQYAANATEDKPLIIQGFTTTANDGGVAHIAVFATDIFMDDATFDFLTLQDIKMTGNMDGDGLIKTDQNSTFVNCSFVNASTTGYPVGTDWGAENGLAVNCYFEGQRTGTLFPNGSPRLVNCMSVNRGIGGTSAGTDGTAINCLFVIEGNMGSADLGWLGSAVNCAAVCLGTNNAASVGFGAADTGMVVGCFAENVGIAYQQGAGGTQGTFVGNSYFNIDDADAVNYPASSHPAYADDPVDTGTSIFTSLSTTAALSDFTVRKKRNTFDASNISITAGFNDTPGTDDKTFQVYTDAGLGWGHLPGLPRRNIREG